VPNNYDFVCKATWDDGEPRPFFSGNLGGMGGQILNFNTRKITNLRKHLGHK